MKKVMMILAVLGLVTSTSIGYAEDMAKEMAAGDGKANLLASSLIKAEVKNPAGEKLGEVEELVVNQKSGRIDYAAVSLGGFLGMGEKWFAIPWPAFKTSPDLGQKVVYLDLDKEVLKKGPYFDKNQWPRPDDNWLDNVYKHYGYKYRD